MQYFFIENIPISLLFKGNNESTWFGQLILKTSTDVVKQTTVQTYLLIKQWIDKFMYFSIITFI